MVQISKFQYLVYYKMIAYNRKAIGDFTHKIQNGWLKGERHWGLFEAVKYLSSSKESFIGLQDD